jgi:hypothetical protein
MTTKFSPEMLATITRALKAELVTIKEKEAEIISMLKELKSEEMPKYETVKKRKYRAKNKKKRKSRIPRRLGLGEAVYKAVGADEVTVKQICTRVAPSFNIKVTNKKAMARLASSVSSIAAQLAKKEKFKKRMLGDLSMFHKP